MQKVLLLHDFMLKDEKLKGTKLLVYAFIYSYCQIPESRYIVSWRNAIKFLGISKSSYFDSLQWLIDNEYISPGEFHLIDDSPLTIIENNINLKKYADMTSEEMVKIARTKWVK